MPFRIVVADKDPQTAAELTSIVADRSIECLHVESASELKHAIKNQRPSLIMLAPVLTDTPHWRAAYKIVAAIKKSRDYSQIPVVVFTGHPNGPSESQLRTLGADAYLSTPLDSVETLRLVESLFAGAEGPATQIDDDDILIDFDDDEEKPESYVEDKPIELTSHSEAALEMDDAATPRDEPSWSPGQKLNEELQLENESQDFTSLSFEMDIGGEDAEALDTFEQSSVEYEDAPGASPEEPLELIQDPLNVVEAGRQADDSPDVLRDFTPESDELPEFEHAEPFYGQPESLDASEEGIEHKDGVCFATLQGILPDKNAILDHLTQTIADALPRREELLSLVSDRIDAALPSRDEVLKAVTQRVPLMFQMGTSEIESISAASSPLSSRELIQPYPEESPHPTNQTAAKSAAKASFATPPPFSTGVTVDALVRNIIHERIEEIMPDRDQILQWIRSEIESRILDTAERIIRQKVEEITTDTPHDGI